MNAKVLSTRRLFFWKAGAALSAPLALAAAAGASEAKVSPERRQAAEAMSARLAKHADMDAIRASSQAFARYVNAGRRDALADLFVDPAAAAELDAGIRNLSSDDFGAQDVIAVAADGKSATVQMHCTIEFETPIEPRCPLVDMAREQGGGVVRRSEKGVFENVYVKQGERWKIARSAYRPA